MAAIAFTAEVLSPMASSTTQMVPLDLDKLKSLAEDRGMTIPMLMELAGAKRLGTKIEADLKAKIWKILESRAHAVKIAEVKRSFPQAMVEAIK